jgi:hypothetical protein
MIKSTLKKYGPLTVVAVMAFASASFAQTSITLTGVGDGSIVSTPSLGVYVDPYTATVNGVANTSVICDDWSNDSYVGESWTATVINTPSVQTGSATMFGANSSLSLSQSQLYNALAWLGTQLLSNPTNYANQVAASFAIWELTYNAAGSGLASPDPTSFLADSNAASEQSTVTTLINDAIAAVNNGYVGTGWEILTPVDSTVSCAGSGCPSPNNAASLGVPQEFLVYAPESSSVLMFGAEMIGLLAMAFMFRKRLALSVN